MLVIFILNLVTVLSVNFDMLIQFTDILSVSVVKLFFIFVVIVQD